MFHGAFQNVGIFVNCDTKMGLLWRGLAAG